MPQARITHQPRTASYKTKPPESTSAKQIQRPSAETNKPAVIKATPAPPLAQRPRRSRFLAKKCFMS